MKKLVTIIMAGIFSAITSYAQQSSIGVTAGVSHSWLSHQDNPVYNPTYNIGATYIYSTSEHWGFGLDVKFSREGVKNEYTVFNNKNYAIAKLDYIRVPLRVTYFINDYEHNIRPKISLAPTLGFLTGATEVYKNANGDKYSTSITNNINGFDFGLTGAVGVNFRLSDMIWLTTELAYYNGFLAVNKQGSDNVMNRNISFNAGLTFGIGK